MSLKYNSKFCVIFCIGFEILIIIEIKKSINDWMISKSLKGVSTRVMTRFKQNKEQNEWKDFYVDIVGN